MFDMITELYYLVDENLPVRQTPDPAAQALLSTLSPEQRRLFDAYCGESAALEDAARFGPFRDPVRLALHIP